FGLRRSPCSSNRSWISGRSPTLSTSACVPTTAIPMCSGTIRRRTNGDWSPFVPVNKESSPSTPKRSRNRTDALFPIADKHNPNRGRRGKDEGEEVIFSEGFTGPLKAICILGEQGWVVINAYSVDKKPGLNGDRFLLRKEMQKRKKKDRIGIR